MSNECANVLRRHGIAFIGAIATSTLLLGAAVTPAQASPSDASAWRVGVERGLRANMRAMDHIPHTVRRQAVSIVMVRFDDAGQVADLSLAKGSGHAALDAEAMRAAQATHIRRLPRSLRGTTRAVPMEIYFVHPERFVGRAQVRHTALALAAGAGRHEVPVARS
jgi:TonB family protein